MADLITNQPDGVMTLHGMAVIEDGSLRLRFRVVEGEVPQDWTGWTVDQAHISTADGRTQLVSLAVAFEAEGWVRVDGNLAQMKDTLAKQSRHPNGMPALLTVRIKDPSTWPVYLIAPSTITIKNGPGSLT